MTRRFDRYITDQQASGMLNLPVSEILAMLAAGQLHGKLQRPTKEHMVSSTDVELIRRRLETSRRLEGDVQQ